MAVTRGNSTRYLWLLHQFAPQHGDDAARLAGSPHDEALLIAHSLKGAAATLGAHRVAAAAADLEAHLRKAATPSVPAPLLAALSEALSVLCQAVAAVPTASPQPGAEMPADPQALMTQLAFLLGASDMQAIALAEAHAPYLRARLGAQGDAFYEHLERFDFDAALRLIEDRR